MEMNTSRSLLQALGRLWSSFANATLAQQDLALLVRQRVSSLLLSMIRKAPKICPSICLMVRPWLGQLLGASAARKR